MINLRSTYFRKILLNKIWWSECEDMSESLSFVIHYFDDYVGQNTNQYSRYNMNSVRKITIKFEMFKTHNVTSGGLENRENPSFKESSDEIKATIVMTKTISISMRIWLQEKSC